MYVLHVHKTDRELDTSVVGSSLLSRPCPCGSCWDAVGPTSGAHVPLLGMWWPGVSGVKGGGGRGGRGVECRSEWQCVSVLD